MLVGCGLDVAALEQAEPKSAFALFLERNIFFITLGCCGLLLALHISGAALGGAAIGGILGWLGSLFLLATWRLEIIVPLTAFALWQSLSKRPLRLGCQRQVPRQWNQTLPPGSRYFFWGLLLGSG